MAGLRLKNKSRRRTGRTRSQGRGTSPARASKSARAGARRAVARRGPALRLPSVRWSLKRTAIAVSAAVLVVGTAAVILSAPGWGRGNESFLLSEFEVRGNNVLTDDEVITLSGAEIGENLLDVRISALEEAVAASPRVYRARARRVLPDRVVLTLDEKRPAALVAAGVADLLEVTEKGEVLPPVAQSGALDLPVITGAVGDVSVGTEELSPELSDALAMLARARDVSEGLWMEISEVRIAPGSGLVIYTVADGAEIRVGSGALDSSDLERLWLVIRDIRDRGLEAETIDLRYRDQVVVRFS
jgi:cell division protein FtsQ